MDRIRLLVVDDHPVVRAGLRTLLSAQDDIDVVGEAEDGRAAIELAAEELRSAQAALSEVTGEITSDDLLGEIFSSFCIGK